MKELEVFNIFEAHGFNKDESAKLAEAIAGRDQLATKLDLKDLELRIIRQYNINTMIMGVLILATSIANFVKH